MPHIAPWYRREDYARVREIMSDGDRSRPASMRGRRRLRNKWRKQSAKGLQDHLMMAGLARDHHKSGGASSFLRLPFHTCRQITLA
jgi:hypothetical protein